MAVLYYDSHRADSPLLKKRAIEENNNEIIT